MLLVLWKNKNKTTCFGNQSNTTPMNSPTQINFKIVTDIKLIHYRYSSNVSALSEVTDSIKDIALHIAGSHRKAGAKILPGSAVLDDELPLVSSKAPTEDIKKNKPSDKLAFIYTSGTTGLPKAAVMTHVR